MQYVTFIDIPWCIQWCCLLPFSKASSSALFWVWPQRRKVAWTKANAFGRPVTWSIQGCKLHMGGLRRILLNPQLRQRGWILSPATWAKKLPLCIWRDTVAVTEYSHFLSMQVVWMFRLICQPSILSEMGKRLIFVPFFFRLGCGVPVCLWW